MALSTHCTTAEDNGHDAPSEMGLALDGYTPIAVPAQWEQTGKYVIPLMSPSRGKIVLRRDVIGDISVRPNVYMPIWKAPTRGRIVTNTNGTAQTPMNSYSAGQVNVNAFIANSDLSSTVAASFIAAKSARSSPTQLSQSSGD